MRTFCLKPFVPILFYGGIFSLFFTFAFVSKAEASTFYPGSETVNRAKQNRWVKNTSQQLKKVNPEDCTNSIVPRVVDIEGLYLKAYRLNGPEGCIYFPNGDWIYLIAHSSHEDPKIGDLTLAIDRQQQIFINTGHVCGGIINFYIDTEAEIFSSQDFFELFMSDCDDCKWKKFN